MRPKRMTCSRPITIYGSRWCCSSGCSRPLCFGKSSGTIRANRNAHSERPGNNGDAQCVDFI
jgi:hypothetical protein